MITTTIFEDKGRYYILVVVDNKAPLAIEIKEYQFEALKTIGVPIEKE